MRVSVKIDRDNKRYAKMKSDIRKKVQNIIIYGVNEVRNTAVENILRGAKTGKTYQKYNPRREHTASSSGEYPASDTGFLANNITMNINIGALRGEIISNADYSSHLEFGTSKMGARPFMQPSAELVKPKIRSRIRKLF